MKYFEVLFYTITSNDERISHNVQVLLRKIPKCNQYKIKWSFTFPLADKRTKTEIVDGSSEIEAIDNYIHSKIGSYGNGIDILMHTEVKL